MYTTALHRCLCYYIIVLSVRRKKFRLFFVYFTLSVEFFVAIIFRLAVHMNFHSGMKNAHSVWCEYDESLDTRCKSGYFGRIETRI